MEIAKRRGERGPGDAIADRVDRLDSKQVSDCVDRVELTLEHIIVEPSVGDALVSRLPADHEQRNALVDAPFDEAFLRREVEDVETIDPRRQYEDPCSQPPVRPRRKHVLL